MEVILVFPEMSEDAISDGLRALTKQIGAKSPDVVAHGFLGGEHGYGAHFEDDVFVMRPYYWGECDCGADEREDAFWMENAHSDDCYQTERYFSTEGHYPICALELPNFRHKASSVEVRWYKYIGRGMEVAGEGDMVEILRECFDSLEAA